MKNLDKYISILRKTQLFYDISEKELSGMLICLNATTQTYKKNSFIWLAGQEYHSIGLVVEGQVQIIKENVFGERTIISILERADLFGETFVCAGIKTSPVTVYTASGCEIMFLTFPKIINSCQNSCVHHKKLIENLLNIIAQKNVALNSKLDILSRRTIRDKLTAYLTKEFEKQKINPFSIPINREELADLLCVDRSAVSRELSKMRKDGIIDYHKNTFKITDFDKLEGCE